MIRRAGFLKRLFGAILRSSMNDSSQSVFKSLQRLSIFADVVGCERATIRSYASWAGSDTVLAILWTKEGRAILYYGEVVSPLAGNILNKKPGSDLNLKYLSTKESGDFARKMDETMFWVGPSNPVVNETTVSNHLINLYFKSPDRPLLFCRGYGTDDEKDPMAKMLDFFLEVEDHFAL